MQRKLAHSLIFLGLTNVLLAHEECDSSVGHCQQGDSHSIEGEENKYKEELNAFESENDTRVQPRSPRAVMAFISSLCQNLIPGRGLRSWLFTG